MKKITFILAVLATILIQTNLSAQTVFVLQNGNRTLFYSSMSDVTTNLQNGDTLYLPPKPIDGSFTFDKQVAIIGAGYHTDTALVTGITKITGHVYFAKGSKGSSMTGVRTEGNVYVRDSSITTTRCSVASIEVQNGSNPISQVYFGDCVIRGNIEGCNDIVTNILVERCVIKGNVGSGNKTNNLMVKNCVFTTTGSWLFSYLQNLIVQNCIIVNNASYFLYNSSSITFTNNLFVHAEFSSSSFSMTGNVFGVTQTDIFVDEANGDYHIKPTLTQALTLATDGKEVGVFGTNYPFLVPTYAPRFISINNAENVVDGKLSVKMKVEARDR
ncbi:exported hypothetical protein [uncultured Paludibacter sp.]|nr:exported hypothetical protein [uncultured Paludibacter sp.]